MFKVSNKDTRTTHGVVRPKYLKARITLKSQKNIRKNAFLLHDTFNSFFFNCWASHAINNFLINYVQHYNLIFFIFLLLSSLLCSNCLVFHWLSCYYCHIIYTAKSTIIIISTMLTLVFSALCTGPSPCFKIKSMFFSRIIEPCNEMKWYLLILFYHYLINIFYFFCQ